MKDKEERKLQFVLWYYEDGKLDTRKALKKITGIAHQNKVSGFGLIFRNRRGYPYLCSELYLVKPEGASYCVNYGRCDGDKIFSARQYAGYTFPRSDFGI